MSLSSTTNRLTYAGNGTSTSFSFPYYFFATTDLNVYLYDTLLGGITSQVMGVNYTVSGAANFSGLYPNGANIIFTTAPISTSIVVIVRNPPEVQTYNLAQNANISSSALNQQLDYLTLLIQRLEDQVSRSLYLPDGLGSTFSAQLPANAPQSPGQYLMVNAAGNGLSWTTSVNSWQTLVVPYTMAQTASTTITILIATVPAGTVLTGIVLKHTTAFAGTLITAVKAQVGVAADAALFINGQDVFQAPGDGVFDSNSEFYLTSFANGTALNLTMTATGANLSALTAGSLTVYFRYENI